MGKVGIGQMGEVETAFLADGSTDSNKYAHRTTEAGGRADHQQQMDWKGSWFSKWCDSNCYCLFPSHGVSGTMLNTDIEFNIHFCVKHL